MCACTHACVRVCVETHKVLVYIPVYDLSVGIGRAKGGGNLWSHTHTHTHIHTHVCLSRTRRTFALLGTDKTSVLHAVCGSHDMIICAIRDMRHTRTDAHIHMHASVHSLQGT